MTRAFAAVSLPPQPHERGDEMPKVSKDSVEGQDHGPVLEYSGDVDGYTVNFVTFREDLD